MNFPYIVVLQGEHWHEPDEIANYQKKTFACYIHSNHKNKKKMSHANVHVTNVAANNTS